ncbi:MAG TPA: DinB family protein [Acidobacteriota bacterium]|nr:DinB family protein [Acidobacteriota bacterium]
MEEIRDLFIDFSVRKLNLLASRIDDCLSRLDDKQVWLRDSDNMNAVGNLVLHLCGNVRQWAISAIGGAEDIRQRDAEFAAREGVSREDLRQMLSHTVREATEVLNAIQAERLTERLTVQKYTVTVLEAVYAMPEHFAQHTGQIIFATKLLTGEDLGYYAHLSKPAHSERTP